MPEAERRGRYSASREISIWAGTQRIGSWKVGSLPGEFEVMIPADWIRQEHAAIVTLRTGGLVSKLELGLKTDPRRFGIFLTAVSFTPTDRKIDGQATRLSPSH